MKTCRVLGWLMILGSVGYPSLVPALIGVATGLVLLAISYELA